MFSALHVAVNDKLTYHPAKCSKGYKRAFRIALESLADAKKWPFYECDWVDKLVTRVRIDFVPVDLGYDGLIDLHCALVALMDGGWTFFIEHGRVSRLDVAVDFPNLQMDQLHFLPTQCQSTKQWSSKGMLESFQLGKSKGSHTLIYDRKAKRSAQGKSWQGKTGIRVERRLKYLGLPLGDIANMANPFAQLDVIERHVPPPSAELKPYIWKLFLAAADGRGLSAALQLLPQDKRTAYRKHLLSAQCSMWDSQSLWARWKPMLAEMKIVAMEAWN